LAFQRNINPGCPAGYAGIKHAWAKHLTYLSLHTVIRHPTIILLPTCLPAI